MMKALDSVYPNLSRQEGDNLGFCMLFSRTIFLVSKALLYGCHGSLEQVFLSFFSALLYS